MYVVLDKSEFQIQPILVVFPDVRDDYALFLPASPSGSPVNKLNRFLGFFLPRNEILIGKVGETGKNFEFFAQKCASGNV